jgi:xanthine/uracil/vitamin C permease (AzgA family)
MKIDSSEEKQESAASKLFDLRLIIGGLFTLYGVILTIVGALDSATEVNRAAGVRINFWMGLGMLVLGLLFLLWVYLSPLRREPGGMPSEPAGSGSAERT